MSVLKSSPSLLLGAEDLAQRSSRLSSMGDFDAMLLSGETVLKRGRDEGKLGEDGSVSVDDATGRADGETEDDEQTDIIHNKIQAKPASKLDVILDDEPAEQLSSSGSMSPSRSTPMLASKSANSAVVRSASSYLLTPRRLSTSALGSTSALDTTLGTGSNLATLPSSRILPGQSGSRAASTSSARPRASTSYDTRPPPPQVIESMPSIAGLQLDLSAGSASRRGSFDSSNDMPEPPKSAFQLTMRKTSQFFRKFGSSKSGAATSAPGTPVEGRFSRSPSSATLFSGPPPPVPAVPSQYASIASSTSSRILGASSAPPVLELHLSGQPTLQARRQQARRRSISLDAVAPRPRPLKKSAESTQDERTKVDHSPTDLQRWGQDLDGVLDSIGSTPPAAGVKPVPAALLTGATPLTVVTRDKLSPVEEAVLSQMESPLEALFRTSDLQRVALGGAAVEVGEKNNIAAEDISSSANPAGRSSGTTALMTRSQSAGAEPSTLETIVETTHSRETSDKSPADFTTLPHLVPLPPSLAASPALGSDSSFMDVILPSVDSAPTIFASSPAPTIVTPLEDEAPELARKCWEEDESFLDRKKIAEWLGSTGSLRADTLHLYMAYFDFTNLRLDAAFRRLCEKLYLKAESQQVDRILAAFSQRYWKLNPNCVYGTFDAVYAISYAILLLNTDLHVADITKHMSRSEFIENTLSTITTGPTPSPAISSSRSSGKLSLYSVFGGDATSDRPTSHWSSVQSLALKATNGSSSNIATTRNSDVESDPLRPSEAVLVTALKDIYNAIKALPVAQAKGSSLSLFDGRSSLSLSPMGTPYNTWNGTSRSPSRRSATSSMGTSFKRSSIRGINSFLGSAELNRSTSSTLSTSTSLSDENINTAYKASRAYSTIGFASTLSHSMVIREQQEEDAAGDEDAALTEEELALSGAPWAKEGIIQRKHFWESPLKRAKDKAWLQVFVVISKGELRMFRFDGAGTVRGGGGGMGGGDWMTNANSVGQVSLVHALCSALAAPGYNKSRPHCFVLTLPEGGSYFFEAGTQDLVAEWVSTCNYWSARYSKLPLSGGVSNMEYGWSMVMEGGAEDAVDDRASIRSGRSMRSENSRQSKFSYRGLAPSSTAGASIISTGSGDRVFINEWKPSNVPMGESTLSEDAQLDNLKRHTRITRAELAHHNTLRSSMTQLFSSHSVNQRKAEDNWKRKSQYLLSEVVKYQTYVDALMSAVKLKSIRRGEKQVATMLELADAELSAGPVVDHVEV